MIKVYGPYLREDGRKHVIWYDTKTKQRRTQSYPRYLMEQHLGRKLLPEETVDHINEDFTDDRIENLQLLSTAENNRKANLGRPSPLKGIEKGWTHGTMYAWQKKGCRCELCYPLWREWNDKRNEKRRTGIRGPYNKRA